ncbi:phospholipase effector Tle1 domain-containing protein [Nocardia takedensis]|uniref:phospholipase effector Tle1 domain-containing protein n=1 Tax=Nocardia takedensis TaxID=259390 RepID=UPI003F7577DD
MKRLVVCCDGTWKAESSSTVSNIVKIAQTVCVSAPGPHGAVIPQWVSYVSGPGARGFLTDRMVGGAFGLGLEANLSSAYWHLALNWEPGDEIYLFGFSRGAFTARSLAGLISRIGLLTPAAMIDGRYPDALALYRQPPPVDGSTPPSWERFRAEHCRHPARIIS